MYTFVDPNALWPQVPMATAMPANQIYVAQIPMLLGGGNFQPLQKPQAPPSHATTNQPVYYNMQQNWFPQNYTPAINGTPQPPTPAHYPQPPQPPPQPQLPQSHPHDSRSRALSDEVFIHDNGQPQYPSPNPSHILHNGSRVGIPKRRKRGVGAREDILNDNANHASELSKRGRAQHRYVNREIQQYYGNISPTSDGRSNGSSVNSSPPQIRDNLNLNEESFTQSSSGSGSNKETDINDYSLFNIFSSSLYSALNRDPPEPTPRFKSRRSIRVPVRTSSPIPEDERAFSSSGIVTQIPSRKHKSRVSRSLVNESGSSDVQEINEMNISCDGTISNRREKFLQALEAERERQRAMTLPKHAPKMSCKFCKNNGESEDVYTKHRLHYKEKTVCPLLRMYVCRLCNSTGDFAHTIRHCPLNSRFDKVAWKATFL